MASVALEGGRGTVPTSGWFGRGACPWCPPPQLLPPMMYQDTLSTGIPSNCAKQLANKDYYLINSSVCMHSTWICKAFELTVTWIPVHIINILNIRHNIAVYVSTVTVTSHYYSSHGVWHTPVSYLWALAFDPFITNRLFGSEMPPLTAPVCKFNELATVYVLI